MRSFSLRQHTTAPCRTISASAEPFLSLAEKKTRFNVPLIFYTFLICCFLFQISDFLHYTHAGDTRIHK